MHLLEKECEIKMRIFVDADACPVKDSVIEVAKKNEIPIYMVCSLSHVSHFGDGVESIIVDNVSEAADMAIVNKTKKGDLVITQDYGLAAMVLGKKCLALHHNGFMYTNDNIEELLFKRHLHSKIRRGGGKHKGPKAFTQEDRDRFKELLITVVKKRDNSRCRD
jgi:uncharacterized protein YaiI (UPF0178 family)